MELNQLRYFVAAADLGSFSRAAEKLFVVQSNVSNQIRKLEGELRAPLFERRAHQVVLTEFGRALLPEARQALAATDNGRAAVDAVRDVVVGRAAVGVPGTVAGWLMPDVIKRFREMHPAVDLWITEEASTVLAGMVASRELPQAIINMPHPHEKALEGELLFEEELVAVVPCDHARYGAGVAPLTAFRGDRWLLPEAGNSLRSLIIEKCASVGFAPATRVEFGRKQLMREMANAGAGVALLPVMTALLDLRYDRQRLVRIETPRLARRVSLIRNRSASCSPANGALGRLIRDVLTERIQATVNCGLPGSDLVLPPPIALLM